MGKFILLVLSALEFYPAFAHAQISFEPLPPPALAVPRPTPTPENQRCNETARGIWQCRFALDDYAAGNQFHPNGNAFAEQIVQTMSEFQGYLLDGMEITGFSDRIPMSGTLTWLNIDSRCKERRKGKIGDSEKKIIEECYHKNLPSTSNIPDFNDWEEVSSKCKATMNAPVSNEDLAMLRACHIQSYVESRTGSEIDYDYFKNEYSAPSSKGQGKARSIKGIEQRNVEGGEYRKVEVMLLLNGINRRATRR